MFRRLTWLILAASGLLLASWPLRFRPIESLLVLIGATAFSLLAWFLLAERERYRNQIKPASDVLTRSGTGA